MLSIANMTAVAALFREAHLRRSGPLLASTLEPISPSNDPNRLRSFYNGFNSGNPLVSIKFGLLGPVISKCLSETESQAWVDLYAAFWNAAGELITSESAEINPDWSKIYDAWKEVANVLIRGYSSAGFQAWTVPCMYVVGKYLRIFAIKADAIARESGTDVKFDGDGFQDDIIGDNSKNEKLEDAARQINRMFTLCISDRYVEELFNMMCLTSLLRF